MLPHLKFLMLLSFFVCSATFATASQHPLQVWIMPNGVNPQGILEQRLELFTKETGIKTQVVVLDWGEAWSRISTALESGNNGPAVVQLGTSWVSHFASHGQLANLDPWLSEINPNRYIPVSWGTTGIDGNSTVYSIPWFVDVRALLGNRRILAEHGITAKDIASYEGFCKAVKKINDAKETLPDGAPILGYAFPGKSDWNIPHNFAPWIWSSGGDFLVKKTDGHWESNLMDSNTIMGIGKYLRFVLDSIVDIASLRENTAQITQRFNNGELAFILNTAEVVMQTRYQESMGGLAKAPIGSDGILVFPVPAGNAGSISFIGGSNLAIPKNMEKNENARKLLLFLTRDDNLEAYTSKIGFIPPTKTVLQSWAKDSIYNVLVKRLETGKAYPNIPNWGNVENELIQLFSHIWELMDVGGFYSEEAVYKALVEYNQKINDLLIVQNTGAVMDYDEFETIWRPAVNGSITSSEITSSSAPEAKTESQIPKTIGILLVAMLFGFVYAFVRKRKG